MISIYIKTNDTLYIKDPEKSDLGRKIVESSIELIHNIGFEKFTFKKLADDINSTEASVYRYFKNKHQLLVYLSSWYWAWIDFQIKYKTTNIPDPYLKLKIIIKVISESSLADPNIIHVDESLLHKIIISESSKAYLTKNVDRENKEGYFKTYKSLCNSISRVFLEINPDYAYPTTLASNLIETAHEQIFFAEHIPSLTDLRVSDNDYRDVCSFLENMFLKILSK